MSQPSAHRPGRRLAVDVGTVRVGVAMSDPTGSLATPLETVPRNGRDIARLVALVGQYEVVEVVVGLPRHLSGTTTGASALDAERYAERLARRIAPVPVHLVDERLSTVAATRGLRERGVGGRGARSVVDQEAAAFVLQGWLDAAVRLRD